MKYKEPEFVIARASLFRARFLKFLPHSFVVSNSLAVTKLYNAAFLLVLPRTLVIPFLRLINALRGRLARTVETITTV